MIMKKFLSLLLMFSLLLLCSCDKQALDDIQNRLDQLEKTTIVSINSQIQSVKTSISAMENTQKQLQDYLQKLESQGTALQDVVAEMQQKVKQFSSDLQALQKLVDQNADDVNQWIAQATITLSKFGSLETQMNEILNYLDSVNSRLTGLEASTKTLTDSMKKNQADIQEIQLSLKALRDEITEIKAQIEALVSSVQSVVVVPDYSDGSVEISNVQDNLLYFEVYPLSAAGLLAKMGASAVSLDAVATKAGGKDNLNLPVSATSFDGRYFSITADGSNLPKGVKTGDILLNARLLISDGTVTRSSEYFPLSVNWDPSRDTYTYVADPVDMGLSVKWSAYNLGASSPEGYGAVFAWGETETKAVFNWGTYKWCEGVENTLTKYCTNAQFGTVVDDKIVLEPDDDVVRVKLGGGWRMPTREELAELLNSCKWAWKSDYEGSGVSGFVVTSLVEGFEDRSIFLPAAGYTGNVGPQYAGDNGSYWSASLSNAVNPVFIYCLGFDFLGPNEGAGYRFHGRSIRPVIDYQE